MADEVIVLETTKGEVVIGLRPDLAPGHVARIKEPAIRPAPAWAARARS
jgi:hypothetical protein